MIKLIGCGNSVVEDIISKNGLLNYSKEKSINKEYCIYGCGNFIPGKNIDLLINQKKLGNVIGAMGVMFSSESVALYNAQTRGNVGSFLSDIGNFYVYDELSKSWSLHYSTISSIGGHPGWLANANEEYRLDHLYRFDPLAYLNGVISNCSDLASEQFCNSGINNSLGFYNGTRLSESSICLPSEYDHLRESIESILHERDDLNSNIDFLIAFDVGSAILSCLSGMPFIIVSKFYKQDHSHPVGRLAAKIGCIDRIAYGINDFSEKVIDIFNRKILKIDDDIIKRERNEAEKTLNSLISSIEGDKYEKIGLGIRKSDADKIDSLLGGTSNISDEYNLSKISIRQRAEIGSEFNPSTHYTNNYFGGMGTGIEYLKPNGDWDVYQGPARSWSGNRNAAKILSNIIKPYAKLLDIGCGYGDFVRKTIEFGYDSYGVDISIDAIESSFKDIKDRLIHADITEEKELFFNNEYDITTALDFWEHIFESDLTKLLNSVRLLTKVGGIHFAIICTRGDSESDQVFPKGVKFSKENSWCLVSGHVNVRRLWYWIKLFRDNGFIIRFDLMSIYQIYLSEDPSMKMCMSWSPRNLLIAERRN